MKLVHWLFAFCLFTASFDIFLVVNLGGTIRIAQVVMILVCLGALAKAVQDGNILWPAGGTALLLWCGVQVVFWPLSIDLGLGFRFLLFLFFTVACFYAVVHLYGRSTYIESLMKVYLGSYIFVAAFGILQLTLPLLHLGGILVAQWFVRDRLPRINGFCYEPSYYATYMIMGWIMLLDLRASKARITAGRQWQWLTILVSSALFLSTSKTAWIFMMMEVGLRLLPVWLRWSRGVRARLGAGSLKVRMPRWRRIFAGVLAGSLAVGGVVMLGRTIDLNMFISGTGLNNTGAHSVTIRHEQFADTWEVFTEHPWIGRSLGGVSSRICQIRGIANDGKTHVGFPVIIDLLAASGLIGILPFLWFVGANTIGMFRIIKDRWPDERAKWLRALVRAMIYECAVLVVDQNVLRIYIWFHVSILAAVALHLRYEPRLRGRDQMAVRQLQTKDAISA
jgi:hypothetical protein